MQLTIEQAAAFVELPLAGLRREYPNHLSHALNSADDAQTPRALHPVFYGCYDWHSAVHGYWLLARCARLYPTLAAISRIEAIFEEHFTEAALQQELAYFQAPSRRSFERTYGWAWLLALAQELDCWSRATVWRSRLQTLVDEIRGGFLRFLPIQSYPIRVGTHPNTAFGLKLALDFARQSKDNTLEAALVGAAQRYFSADRKYPAQIEPGGDEFLSGGLCEGLLMASVLGAGKFPEWFTQFLPDLSTLTNLLYPAEVSDRSDPKIAHLDGLNLSRVWCMKGIARHLPTTHPARAQLLDAARRHLDASLPHVASGHYEGEHWLATFALLALGE